MARSKREYRQLSAEALSAIGLIADEHIDDPTMRFPRGKARRLETPVGVVWVKVYEPVTSSRVQRLMRGALNLLPAATLAKTSGGHGEASLLRQAEQAEVLRQAGFNTPTTIYISQQFHITGDVGATLSDMVSELKNKQLLDQPGAPERARFEKVLLAATSELTRLHKAGLAHGRPKLRDFSWKTEATTAENQSTVGNSAAAGEIFLFDLDERPWEHMTMADAQGRDMVLWMLDICQLKVPLEIAARVCDQLLSSAPSDALESVRKTRKAMAPVLPLASFVQLIGVRSRELDGGLSAYKLIRQYFAAAKNQS